MNNFRDIMSRLKLYYGVKTDKEVSNKLNINYNTLKTWGNRGKVPLDTLIKSIQNETISIDWLLTGKENIVMHDFKAIPNTFEAIPDTFSSMVQEPSMHSRYKTEKQQTQLLQPQDEIEINYYPEVYASAGYGTTNDTIEPQTLTVSKFFISTLRIANMTNIDIIRIYGDSMEPDFRNGEYVIVERVNSLEEVNNGNTVIANISGDIYIKKIEKIPFEKGIILNSSNTNYEPIKVEPHNLHELNVVGIVRGSITPH